MSYILVSRCVGTRKVITNALEPDIEDVYRYFVISKDDYDEYTDDIIAESDDEKKLRDIGDERIMAESYMGY